MSIVFRTFNKFFALLTYKANKSNIYMIITNNYEQQLFLSSFYCYLKYDNENDYVIDLDNIWNWLGFGQKVNAKRVLEKNFTINKDYKLLLCQLAKQTTNTKGGHNKEIFMLKTNYNIYKRYFSFS